MGAAPQEAIVGESNIGGPSGRKRAGVGSAVADISDINDSAGCGEAPIDDRGPNESVSPAIADLADFALLPVGCSACCRAAQHEDKSADEIDHQQELSHPLLSHPKPGDSGPTRSAAWQSLWRQPSARRDDQRLDASLQGRMAYYPIQG